MGFRRVGLSLGITVVDVFAFAAGASAKDGFVATLTSSIPANAGPGTKIDVRWTITRPASDGALFNASSVFVRLRCAAHEGASEGYASSKAHTDGAYRAEVTVPPGGISAVEIGVAGMRTDSSGTKRADLLFPITNPPALAGAGSGSWSGGAWSWLLPMLAGVLVLALVALALHRGTGGLRSAPGFGSEGARPTRAG